MIWYHRILDKWYGTIGFWQASLELQQITRSIWHSTYVLYHSPTTDTIPLHGHATGHQTHGRVMGVSLVARAHARVFFSCLLEKPRERTGFWVVTNNNIISTVKQERTYDTIYPFLTTTTATLLFLLFSRCTETGRCLPRNRQRGKRRETKTCIETNRVCNGKQAFNGVCPSPTTTAQHKPNHDKHHWP